MTAVEWLIKELKLEGYDYTIQQAKEMEKQQIIDAYNEGDCFPQDYHHGADYYSKTYKQLNNDWKSN